MKGKYKLSDYGYKEGACACQCDFCRFFFVGDVSSSTCKDCAETLAENQIKRELKEERGKFIRRGQRSILLINAKIEEMEKNFQLYSSYMYGRDKILEWFNEIKEELEK